MSPAVYVRYLRRSGRGQNLQPMMAHRLASRTIGLIITGVRYSSPGERGGSTGQYVLSARRDPAAGARKQFAHVYVQHFGQRDERPKSWIGGCTGIRLALLELAVREGRDVGGDRQPLLSEFPLDTEFVEAVPEVARVRRPGIWGTALRHGSSVRLQALRGTSTKQLDRLVNLARSVPLAAAERKSVGQRDTARAAA